MGLPDLYPAQVGSPYTTLAAPYTTGDTTLTVVDATKLPDAPNIVCLAGSASGEFRYSGKDGNTLLGVVKLPGAPNATWPAGTFAFRGISAYDHASIVEHLTYQRSHIVEASLDLTTNHSYSGRVLEGAEAGENLAFGDLAVLAESGKFMKANPAALATLDGTIALVVSDTIAAGSQGMFLLRGLIRNDSWTFSPGKELYASNGTLTHEPPTTGTQIIRKVGTALTATIIEFNPSSALHAEYLVSVLPVNTVTKDNGDVERKFWKDDFSMDSSSQYTGDVGSFTWDTANRRLTITGATTVKVLRRNETFSDGKISFSGFVSAINPSVQHNAISCPFRSQDSTGMNEYRVFLFNPVGSENSYIYLSKYVNSTSASTIASQIVPSITSDTLVEMVVSGSNFKVYVNGALQIDATDTTYISGSYGLRVGTGSGITAYITSFTVSPSISYADNFTTDTTERYQPVYGTVAYDDTNKRMNVTTASGANGKASGRLKSYKFCEGAQQFDVTLPVGEDGDFICMVTHATNGAMDNGIGVGLQSDGAGNWNLATLSGTTVTEGASSGLVDGKTARIEIEKDLSGAYWYYIYDAAGAKPTTATGKLFTTLSEGYTGWYANGAGATTQTYAIDNISIRAESIVGRTNVQVTEDVFNSVTGEIESRTYFKPIHRGAMLETYHDGTQEVVGTTFIDDCQWDRSAEYVTASGTFTRDVTNGEIYVSAVGTGSFGALKPKLDRFGDGYIELDTTVTTDRTVAVVFCWDGVVRASGYYNNGYSVTLRGASEYKALIIQKRVNNVTTVLAEGYISFTETNPHRITVVKSGSTITASVYTIDGTLIKTITATDSTYTEGYCGIFNYGAGSKYHRYQIIAAESNSTNGIAACIPPIGGGARYGVEESVYIPITPGTEIPVGSVVISPNAKSTVVGTALTTFAQTPAGVSASLEYATGTKACPGLSTAFAPAGRHRVKADRNTLTNIGVKGSVAGTSPTVYIDSLHVLKQEVA